MNDRLQGVSHDRILMRVKDYIQILTTVGALLWGGVQIVRKLDEVENKLQQIDILQQQVSSLQQLVVNSPAARKK